MKEFYSNGKLLITGEYAILDGAKALAAPTKFGQSLELKTLEGKKIIWNSFDQDNTRWFQGEIKYQQGKFDVISGEEKTGKKLKQILKEADRLNPEVFSKNERGLHINTRLNFHRNWGLGTSSTLINNIASWFKIDPFLLLKNTFGGSGYDIAAARNEQPLTYQLTTTGASVLKTNFHPEFSEKIFFIYLNEKKNSREAIAHYKALPKTNKEGLSEKISSLTEQFINCRTLKEFELLIEVHETLMGKALQRPKVKQERFPDFPGAVKSLGGWGGDFVMATGEKAEVINYFNKKNYLTIFEYKDILL